MIDAIKHNVYGTIINIIGALGVSLILITYWGWFMIPIAEYFNMPSVFSTYLEWKIALAIVGFFCAVREMLNHYYSPVRSSLEGDNFGDILFMAVGGILLKVIFWLLIGFVLRIIISL